MGISILFGNVRCELLYQEIYIISQKIKCWFRVLSRLESHIDWQLDIPFYLEVMP